MQKVNRTGSVRRDIVSPDLLEERAKCNFDQAELQTFLHGGEEKLASWKKFADIVGNDEGMRNNVGFYDLSPHEMQE